MAAQTILLSVDSYRNRTVEGRLWCAREEKELPFDNLMQMLLSIETLLNRQNPPGDKKERSCPPHPRPWAYSQAKPTRGALETFRMNILFRQNMSWQGYVSWQDGQREKPFRSELELMLLMDQVLTQAERMKYVQIG